MPTHDSDPTPPHGIERPETWHDRDTDHMTYHRSVDNARANMETEAMQRVTDRWAQRRPDHTWTDVARLVARIDSQAVAAGHPATYGTLHLVTPDAPGDHARIERRGSSDRVPGGSTLPDNADAAYAALTTRLEIYRDLADAGHDSARIYLLNRDE